MRRVLLILLIFVSQSLFANEAPFWSDWYFEDSVVVECSEKEQRTLDLRVEPDTMYRKLLYNLVGYGADMINDSMFEVMSDRESYFILAKQVLTEFKCEKGSDCSLIKYHLASNCKNKEYLNQLTEILYEQQDELVLYTAWETFDRRRCPWYESYRDSIVSNGKMYDLLTLIAVNHNVKDEKECSYLMNEYEKMEQCCTIKKCFQYLIDNNEVLPYSECKFFRELWIHDYGYWNLEMRSYSSMYSNEFTKDPLCCLILGKLQNNTPMFVTSLSCENDVTQQRILLDLEIPMGNRFDLDRCIETVEKENADDKKLKAKVLKALRKAQKN